MFTIFVVSVNMVPYRNKKFKHYYYKSQPKVLKLLLNFLLNGPQKNYVGGFEIFKIAI